MKGGRAACWGRRPACLAYDVVCAGPSLEEAELKPERPHVTTTRLSDVCG
jgi:hypothetical protein